MEETTHKEVGEVKNVDEIPAVVHHTHKKRPVLTTPVAIVIAAFILGGSHIIYGAISNSKNTTPVNIFAGAPVTEKDYATGDTKSDVVIVEYSDTECPFCARLHPTMNQIQNEYKDQISFVYRYFPLTQIHPNAFAEAQAIDCVGKELGPKKRRDYIDQMFTYKISNKSMTLPKNGKEDLAKNIGVDAKTFATCLQGEESTKIVSDSIQDGVQAGVTGTPATFVLKRDGDKYEVFAVIEGAREYEYIKAVVDAALK